MPVRWKANGASAFYLWALVVGPLLKRMACFRSLPACTCFSPWPRLGSAKWTTRFVCVYAPTSSYAHVSLPLGQLLQQAHFRTAEAVACGVARLLISGCGVVKCTVRVVKPASLLYAQGAGVEVTRTCRDFPEGFRRCLKGGHHLAKGATSFDFPKESVVIPHPVSYTHLTLPTIA